MLPLIFILLGMGFYGLLLYLKPELFRDELGLKYLKKEECRVNNGTWNEKTYFCSTNIKEK